MMKSMHKNGVLLSEEINRIKELFGNNFKPVIKEQREIIKEPRKVIKEGREIVLRRAFNIDFGAAGLTAAAQVAKVNRYLTAIEQQKTMFEENTANGLVYPYERLGWRTSNDFMATITDAVADPTLTTQERAINIERVIRQLQIRDIAKFEAKVKVGARTLLDVELRTDGSALRTDLNTALTEVLDAAVESALAIDPNMTTEQLVSFVDATYETIKVELKEDLGDASASLFNPIPELVKTRIRNNPNIETTPDKPKLPRNIWTKLTETEVLRIKQFFEELRKLRLNVTLDGNIENTRELLRQVERYDLSVEQLQSIFERIRQNITSIISGDIADAANFRQAIAAVDAEIDALNLPDATKVELKKQFKLKITLNWVGAEIGEPFDWVTATEKEIMTAHYGGENFMSKAQTMTTGNPPGTKFSAEYFKTFSINLAKRLLNISLIGQLRYLPEIGKAQRGYKGGIRARYLKTYLLMLLIKLLVLPLIELIYNVPITFMMCKRWALKKQSVEKAIKDAGGDETDFAEITKELVMPKGCDVVMNSNWFMGFVEVFKNEANSFWSVGKNLFNAKGEGNWFGTEQSWAITVENVFDTLNPFSTMLDDMASTVYSYQNFNKMTEDFSSKMKSYTDKIKQRIKETEDKVKRDAEILLRKTKELQKNKNYINDTKMVPMAITTYVNVKENSPDYILGQILPQNWNTARNCYVIPDPLDKNISYEITQNNGTTGLQVKGGGKLWVKNAKSEGYNQSAGTLDDFAAYINERLYSVPTEPIKAESRYKKTNNMITERNKEKFGEDNFKHWKDTFTFKAQDDKNPGQYKEVKIKMEDVMDRINHYRKKYDEDDSFVRAVIDTHEDVVKIMFTKDLANIHESATPRGLALVLRVIKESRGEMEIFSVARPANGNWFLVKGDYTPNQLANMDLEKKEPRTKETEVNSKSEDDLKKKEESAINVLKRNEKEGIEDLPKKVRDKVREKMGKGWTTEIPPEELKEYFTTSEINSIFNDKIVIYKLEPTREFFNSLVKYSARIVIKRGFCRTLKSGKNEFELSERQKMTVNHILNKCNTKYESKLGLRNF